MAREQCWAVGVWSAAFPNARVRALRLQTRATKKTKRLAKASVLQAASWFGFCAQSRALPIQALVNAAPAPLAWRVASRGGLHTVLRRPAPPRARDGGNSARTLRSGRSCA